MAGGWARDGAVQDQIDDTVSDAVKAARLRLPQGESEAFCLECGEAIPEKRRAALAGGEADEQRDDGIESKKPAPDRETEEHRRDDPGHRRRCGVPRRH